MNAITYIQQHGVEKAKKILGNAGLLHKSYTPVGGLYHRYEMTGTVSLTELRRLVESVGLIGKFGGFKRAERILKKSYKGWSNSVSVVWNDRPFQCSISQLEQAIADYESIGGEHV